MFFKIYLIIINVVAFFVVKSDKRKAIKNKFRISEKNLFLISILGGSIGFYIGMNYFRHKTNKTKFKIGIPFLMLVQIILLSFFV
ncbi:MAG: DUF1294 domain-containing protein [Peptostreptococcaceae bacterium]|jgi:uncharacterized membrane protein YsdA (DUF1294 family)|nr:DUF1294 domain-containing protein [Peptostreptococcaceae bacterium]